MTETYAREKAAILVRDYNEYHRRHYTGAERDYLTALKNLVYVAGRCGIKIEYKMSRAGYLTLAA